MHIIVMLSVSYAEGRLCSASHASPLMQTRPIMLNVIMLSVVMLSVVAPILYSVNDSI